MRTTIKLLAAGMSVPGLVSAFAQPTFTKIGVGDIVNDGESSMGCAWGDFNSDGFLDLFVWNSGNAGLSSGAAGLETSFLYRNNGDGTFTRVTAGPIADDLGRRGCAWADFDNDGRLDLLVARVDDNTSQTVLYRNMGGDTFIRMPANTIGGVVPVGGGPIGATWADYNNDGFVDVYVNKFGFNWLYRNNGNGGFSSITNKLAGSESEAGYAAGWADYDNDGRSDVFVSVISDPPTRRLYSNLGGGNFQEVTSGSIITDGGRDTAFGWADYDNDGFLDVFVVNPLKGEASFLYHNNGNGTFTRMTSNTAGSIVSDPGGFDQCAWGDYDNDGFLDLFLTATPSLVDLDPLWGATGGNALYHNNGDGSFTRILTGAPVEDIANSVACAWADYDNDGFLDLFVANGGVFDPENDALYHNDGNGNSWLKVRCVGTVSNRSAIGAKVRVKASLRGKTFWQLREINSGNGFSQNPLEAHFGVGDATKVETLRIEWPSGIVQEFQDVPTKQFLTITEPPRLQALRRLADGSFQLSLTAGLGFVYDLQRSTNLAQWTPWTTLTNTSRTVTISDSSETNISKRFYRAVAH